MSKEYRNDNSLRKTVRLGFALLTLAVLPAVAQAGVLNETFGKGYTFLDNKSSVTTIKGSVQAGPMNNSSFVNTFGDGYALVEKKAGESIPFNEDRFALRPGAGIYTGETPKSGRPSAFHTTFGEGYHSITGH